jgi:hypothetical protein
MGRIFQVPRSYRGGGGRRSRAGCRCPSGAKMLSTRGRGRGFVCQSQSFRVIRKRGRRYKLKPFVRAICG